MSYDTSLRKWFDNFTERTGETPESVVLGWEWDYKAEEWPTMPEGVIAWADVPAAILDRVFDDGFGGNNSPNVCAWSESWVISSDNYDGAETLFWLPRNPIAHNPIRPGGG